MNNTELKYIVYQLLEDNGYIPNAYNANLLITDIKDGYCAIIPGDEACSDALCESILFEVKKYSDPVQDAVSYSNGIKQGKKETDQEYKVRKAYQLNLYANKHGYAIHSATDESSNPESKKRKNIDYFYSQMRKDPNVGHDHGTKHYTQTGNRSGMPTTQKNYDDSIKMSEQIKSKPGYDSEKTSSKVGSASNPDKDELNIVKSAQASAELEKK